MWTVRNATVEVACFNFIRGTFEIGTGRFTAIPLANDTVITKQMLP